MANIDTNIAMGYKPVQVENPMNQYAAMSQLQTNQQANQLNALKMQQVQQEIEDSNALRGKDINSPNFISEVGKVNPKLAYELQAKNSVIQGQKIDQQKKIQDLTSQMKRDLSRNPSDANLQAHFEDFESSGLFTPQQINSAQKMRDQLLAMPFADRQPFLASQGASASDLKPTIKDTNLGGTQLTRAFDPYSNVPTTISNIKKTATPGELMVDARARDQLAQSTKILDPQENAALSKAILDGRLDPNKVNSRNSKILAATLIANPNANLVNLSAVAAGATAEGRTLGTINANVASAATEASSMINLVKDYSAKVDRTQYPTLNSIQNAVDKGTGGEDIVRLNTSINSLVNSYARAINPKGVATVEAKKHARDLLNSAFSNGQINAITDVMNQEIDLALAAPMKAQGQLIKSRGGTGTATNENVSAPTSTKLPAGVGADWQLMVDGKGNKAYVNPNNPKEFKEVE